MRKLVGGLLLLLVVAVLGFALALSGMPLEIEPSIVGIGQCEGVCPACSRAESEADAQIEARYERLGAEDLVVDNEWYVLQAETNGDTAFHESARVLKLPHDTGGTLEDMITDLRLRLGTGRYSGARS